MRGFWRHQGISSKENAFCLQKTRTSSSMRSAAGEIWFPVDLHLAFQTPTEASSHAQVTSKSTRGAHSSAGSPRDSVLVSGATFPLGSGPDSRITDTTTLFLVRPETLLSWFVLTHCRHSQSLEKNCWTKQFSCRWELISY